MSRLRTTTALTLARTAGILSRRLGFGGGTSLPGQLARAIDPAILSNFCHALPAGVILIAGTNGKTNRRKK